MASPRVNGLFQRFRIAAFLGLLLAVFVGSVTAYSRWEESVPERALRSLHRGMPMVEVKRALAPARLAGRQVWSPDDPWKTFDDARRQRVTFHGIASSYVLEQTGVNILGTRPDLCFLFDAKGRLQAYSIKRYGLLLDEERTWHVLPATPKSDADLVMRDRHSA